MVDCSPATRATRVRFPAGAIFSFCEKIFFLLENVAFFCAKCISFFLSFSMPFLYITFASLFVAAVRADLSVDQTVLNSIAAEINKNAGMACALFDPDGFYPDYPVKMRFGRFEEMKKEMLG